MKAYEWLSQQGPDVRERAQTADKLVSLYLQAKRRAQWEAPSPASVEAFKADLRNLAEGLRQFDDEPTPLQHAPPPRAATTQQPEAGLPLSAMAPPQIPTRQQSQPLAPIAPPLAPPTEPTPLQAQSLSGFFAIDPQSRIWILEVQNRLNLSSESDAIRALIAIGYERIKDLLPRT